jgi:feruloyl esterase
MINAAAVAKCPGVVPTIIDDPTRCDFDPGSLLCNGADAPNCLTAAQVETVRKIYQGPRNPRTGEQIYPGLERGSEAAGGAALSAIGSWLLLIPGPDAFLGADFYRYMVFGDPSWSFRSLDFDHDIAFADAKMGPIVDSNSPDLGDFKSLGGKLIMYHGWADPLVNPRNSIDYVNRVAAFFHRGPGGAETVSSFLRLFMAPGMTHCQAGPGLNTFDTLTALERWVEDGIAPDKLVASHTTAAFPDNVMSKTPPPGDFSRPLCAYPKVAHYTGRGSKTDASSFVCAAPQSR